MAAQSRTSCSSPWYDLEIPFHLEDGHSPFSPFLIGMKLPKRNVLGVPSAVTVLVCAFVYARVCLCVCAHLVKGVPNSEHSINTPLISQQYILNSDELIFLVWGWRRRWSLVKMRSTGYKTAIKRELVRLDCKKSIKFCALLPSERSNCVDHKKQRQTARVWEQGVRWGRKGWWGVVGEWRKKERR